MPTPPSTRFVLVPYPPEQELARDTRDTVAPRVAGAPAVRRFRLARVGPQRRRTRSDRFTHLTKMYD